MKLAINCNPDAYKLAASVGFKYVNMWDFGSEIFRIPGKFCENNWQWNYDESQAIVNKIKDAGMDGIGVLFCDAGNQHRPSAETLANPCPVRQPDGSQTPITEHNLWQFYVRVCVHRHPDIRFWRVWNEPSLNNKNGWYLEPDIYAEAVKQAAEIIHDQRALCIAGSGYIYNLRWQDETFPQIAPYIDALQFDYGGQESELQYITRCKALKGRYGLPLWNVEYACHMGPGVEPTAERWRHDLEMHKEAGIDLLSIYFMRNDEDKVHWDLYSKEDQAFKDWAEPILEELR
jgi:hypothetical protein